MSKSMFTFLLKSMRKQTLQPDCNHPVKTPIERNDVVLTPIFEDHIYGQITHNYREDKGS